MSLRSTVKTMNKWHTQGYRSVVCNGQKEYMPPFRAALKQHGIEHKVSWQGKGLHKKCTIYVKAQDIEQAQVACKGLPRDWYAALPKECR